MSYLSQLQLIHNTMLNPNDSVHRRRINMIERLIEQQDMVHAMIERKRYTKMKVPPRQWYWQFEGVYYIHVFHNNIQVSMRNGKSAVVVGEDIASLIPTFGVLILAVENGELDEALKNAHMNK